jgi:hypothetical protein
MSILVDATEVQTEAVLNLIQRALAAKGLKHRPQALVINLLHQRQQTANPSLRKTFAGKPVYIVSPNIGI